VFLDAFDGEGDKSTQSFMENVLSKPVPCKSDIGEIVGGDETCELLDTFCDIGNIEINRDKSLGFGCQDLEETVWNREDLGDALICRVFEVLWLV